MDAVRASRHALKPDLVVERWLLEGPDPLVPHPACLEHGPAPVLNSNGASKRDQRRDISCRLR